MALVVGMADHRASGGLDSLSGVAPDVQRVAAALGRAGFAVQTLVDPDRVRLKTALEYGCGTAAPTRCFC